MSYNYNAHLKEKEGWERSEFPILCETCLGDNPYVRMTRAEFDKECKICLRPFTVFRWRPGTNSRYKKTEVCQVCAKLKNVCQTCLLDLEFGLPVQVRDSVNPTAEQMPTSEAGREYYMDLATRRVENEDLFGKFEPSAMIQKLARTTPYYKRNRAHICSFFVKGECKRGAECPYRHEMPETGELSVQNIKDRYHGNNDPVANKLLKKAETFAKITAPEDTDISTLYIGGLDPLKITEEDLRDTMYSYGEIRSLKIVAHQNCAFVTYTTREGAEKAAEALFNKMYIKGCFLRVSWGKPASAQAPFGAALDSDSTFFSLPAPVGDQPPPPGVTFVPPPASVPAPGTGARPYYPSMDPSQQGSRPAKPE